MEQLSSLIIRSLKDLETKETKPGEEAPHSVVTGQTPSSARDQSL